MAFLAASLFSASFAHAQRVGIKTNLLYDATTTINLGVEVGLSQKLTLDLSGNLNLWTWKDNMKWKHWMAQPELRFWTCERFAGHFFGVHALAGQFNVDGSTVEEVEIMKDHFDEHLLNGVTAKGRLNITAPVGGKLYIQPVGDAAAFEVTPDVWYINPKLNGGNVEISIRRNPLAEGNLSGKFITLSFSVEIGDRIIDANSEILNGEVYRFIL